MRPAPSYELVARLDAWQPVLLSLLADRSQVATGTLLRGPGRYPTPLLADKLDVHATLRTGNAFPPLADWIAVAAPTDESGVDPEEWVRRLQPRFGQVLGILLVGLGRERTDWRGWTAERGLIRPLAGFRLVGPGMVQATRTGSVADRDEDESDRWSRLRGAVGERAFAKVREARGAVVGCSRSGTLAASTLAALGVRSLTLFDGDVVELHNLDGMVLATPDDLGENKAIALGRRLTAFRPDLLVKAVPRFLDCRAAERALGGGDLLVSCVDRDGGRLRAAHCARARLAPHLDIGTGVTRTVNGERQLAADVRLLLPGAGCVRCVGGLVDLDQAEYEFYAPPGALPRRPEEPWDARGRLGSSITLNNLAVSTGVQSWLDLLDGTLAGSVWHRLRWVPGVGLEAHGAGVNAEPGCPLCHSRKQAA